MKPIRPIAFLLVGAAFAAAPHAAHAQMVGPYMQPGGGRGGVSPAGNQPVRTVPQTVMPMRSGLVFQNVRPSYPSGPAQVYGNNAPVFNSRPQGYGVQTFGGGQTYGNGVYGGGVYSGGQIYGGGQTYGNGQTGPIVLPEAAPSRRMSSGIRYRSSQTEAPARTYSNGSGYDYGQATPGRRFPTGRPTAPSGPVGYSNGVNNYNNFNNFGSPVRVTTPLGPQNVSRAYYGNNYVYGGPLSNTGTPLPVTGTPVNLLGGYYYGSYCQTAYAPATYPSVYSFYDGFPRYICNPSVVVISEPYYPVYVTSYVPFFQPIYPVTYNENYYYVTNEDRAHEVEEGGDRAREAIKNAYPADSYQAAFGDIARAWADGDIGPLQRHVRDSDTRISVFLDRKYSYSIASGDFVQITRDALDRLRTTSFEFTHIRKAKNGDVTAYGKHVYRTSDSSAPVSDNGGTARDGDVVPFDQSGTDTGGVDASPQNQPGDSAGGVEKTVYVSYTLRRHDGQWYIVSVNSSSQDLVPTGDK